MVSPPREDTPLLVRIATFIPHALSWLQLQTIGEIATRDVRSDWSTWEFLIPGQWQRPPYKTDALGYVKDAKTAGSLGKTAKKHPNTKSFRKSLADVADVADVAY